MVRREKDWTVLSMLEWATGYFDDKQVANPRLSIEWLLAHVLGIKRLDLYLRFDRPLSPDELEKLRPLVERRSRHEPLQYITGSSDFMNCVIEVNPSVLIPRIETEQLVELILDDYKTHSGKALRILDIGTGSGCIPIAIAKARPEWECTGIDISESAISLAIQNANSNNVQVEFIKADLFSLKERENFKRRKFDIVISNPPYILPEEKKSLEKQVVEYEPEEALFHDNPPEIYSVIGDYASANLRENGALYLECNHKLAGQIGKMIGKRFSKVDILFDYDKKERFIKASKLT